MDYGLNSANCPPPQVPQSRSESLAQYFKAFMEADQRLHNARNQLSRISMGRENAQCELAEAERYWSAASQEFAQLLMAEAPAQMKQQADVEVRRYTNEAKCPEPPSTLGPRW